MKFLKMQAQGNDFIILSQNPDYPLNQLAKKLCDRHFGIGADGLLILSQAKEADIKMRIFNADGTEAEICGSALRCVAKYLNKKISFIETNVGIKKAEFEEYNRIKVNIGKGKFLQSEAIDLYNQRGYYVSMGNPHFVIFTNDLGIADNIADKIAKSDIFENGVNIEFVKVISKTEVKVRVFERGVGETLACGTGASAIQFAGYQKRILQASLLLHFKGGDLYTSIQNEQIYLSGSAEFVFSGEINL